MMTYPVQRVFPFQAYVSLKRILKLLSEDEIDKSAVTRDGNSCKNDAQFYTCFQYTS